MALAALAPRQVVNDSSIEEKGQNFDKAVIVTVIVVLAGVTLGLGAFFIYTCVLKCREKRADKESKEEVCPV